MVAWEYYKTHGSQISDAQYLNQVEKNRYYLKTIAEVVLLCATDELPLRGHDEYHGKSKGVFLDIINFTAKHDTKFAERLSTMPKNATYLSPEMQNEILEVLAGMVVKGIVDDCYSSTYFCLSADETKDVSKKEMLSISLRYYSNSKETMVEHFIGFTYLEALGAEYITQKILEKLGEIRLSLQNCVCVTMDGANTMSGRNSGVQARLKEKNPKILYVHCFNHVLNLCLVKAVASVHTASHFFNLLESLYVFISSSTIHIKFLEFQKKIARRSLN